MQVTSTTGGSKIIDELRRRLASPPPPPPPAPAPSKAVNPPAVVEQQEPVRNTHARGDLQNSGMHFTEVVDYRYGLGSPSDGGDHSGGIPRGTVYGARGGQITSGSSLHSLISADFLGWVRHSLTAMLLTGSGKDCSKLIGRCAP